MRLFNALVLLPRDRSHRNPSGRFAFMLHRQLAIGRIAFVASVPLFVFGALAVAAAPAPTAAAKSMPAAKPTVASKAAQAAASRPGASIAGNWQGALKVRGIF